MTPPTAPANRTRRALWWGLAAALASGALGYGFSVAGGMLLASQNPDAPAPTALPAAHWRLPLVMGAAGGLLTFLLEWLGGAWRSPKPRRPAPRAPAVGGLDPQVAALLAAVEAKSKLVVVGDIEQEAVLEQTPRPRDRELVSPAEVEVSEEPPPRAHGAGEKAAAARLAAEVN